jgi:hypothetical protein
VAAALTQTGSLGEPAEEVDYYQAVCSDDGSGAPASLVAQVEDLPPFATPLVSLQLQKGAAATNTTDPGDGDASASPAVWLNGAAGTYDVFVDKSVAGAESYRLSVQCTTAANGGGVPTGTALTPISTGEPDPPKVPVLSPPGLVGLAAGLTLLGGAALRRRRPPGAAAGLLVLVAAAGWAGAARAHDQNGSLGSSGSATDFYQVTCAIDEDGGLVPARLFLQLRDNTSVPETAALVAVQAQKGALAANATDPSGADALPGPGTAVYGGAGVYDVLIYKTGSGTETYSLTYHCETAPDAVGQTDHTPTSITTRQNQ